MTIFVTKDKEGSKGYVIVNANEAFLIDPRGDFRMIKKAIGEATIKAIFLTAFKTDSLALLAAFGDVPIYLNNTNGIVMSKMKDNMNLSMLNLVFVSKLLTFNVFDLQIRLVPIIGTEKKGMMLVIFNNKFFVGNLELDDRSIKKAVKNGPVDYLYKILSVLTSSAQNVIYPSKYDAFPIIKLVQANDHLKKIIADRKK